MVDRTGSFTPVVYKIRIAGGGSCETTTITNLGLLPLPIERRGRRTHEAFDQPTPDTQSRRGAGKGAFHPGDHQHQANRVWREGETDGASEGKADRVWMEGRDEITLQSICKEKGKK